MTGSAGLELVSVESLDAVREEWVPLADRTQNVFATWEFASIWWRHFGRGRPLLVAMCRSRDGRLVAILPLYRWTTRPLAVVRFLGHGAGDQLGPVCAPDDLARARDALATFLERRAWHVFIGEHLPGDEGWSASLGAAVLTREGSPVLRFGGASWDDFLASRSSNFRQQVRRRERALTSGHAVRFRIADDPARLPGDLDALFALHAARWPGRKTDFLAREAFHREFAACALERGWLRLWLLEADGQTVAAWLGFRFGGVESYYQAGRDPAWDHASVGFVLLVHSIREAARDGADEYRFLLGGEEYKHRFASEDPGLETVALTRGAVGRAALASAVAGRRLRRALRARTSALARQRAERSASRSAARSAVGIPITRASTSA